MMETEEVNEPEATILEKEREVKRKTPKVMISTQIESLVESLFLEE